MNDLRKKMNIINKIIMVDNNILSSISGQIFDAAAELKKRKILKGEE